MFKDIEDIILSTLERKSNLIDIKIESQKKANNETFNFFKSVSLFAIPVYSTAIFTCIYNIFYGDVNFGEYVKVNNAPIIFSLLILSVGTWAFGWFAEYLKEKENIIKLKNILKKKIRDENFEKSDYFKNFIMGEKLKKTDLEFIFLKLKELGFSKEEQNIMLLRNSKELKEGNEIGDISFMLSFIDKLKELNKEKVNEKKIIKQAECFQ